MDPHIPDEVRQAILARDNRNAIPHNRVDPLMALPVGHKFLAADGAKFIRTNGDHHPFCNRETGQLCTAADIIAFHGGLRELPEDPGHLFSLPAITRGPELEQRVVNVMEAVYHQLSTDAELESVSAAGRYASLTNMLAAVLDEHGSPQISLHRRFQYRLEAAMRDWSGLFTP